ncbi:hypothetical protein NLM27_26430 [Bradyrhizobium sp. CCGB12]|uniref:hypothetical protein n=1 Tax=Bradyrhizobium sp. CCGB12 TaxID=2949632 RepID=UPI0020B1AB5C|nr:hypothetical protein [Bradyrhizobium sp. CCGB12]MCP3392292.1 hypothetical protein [Bradyrhizobium sp. CCGB12]
MVETNAGAGIGASDENYRKAGAVIGGSARDVLASCDRGVTVEQPEPSNWVQLRDNQILFTYLQLCARPSVG